MKKVGERGFTLIELLVVIAVIGVLASVILSSLNTTRAKARDAQRISDMRQIQTAMSLYYNQNGTYPPSGGAVNPGPSWSASVDTASWATLATYLSPYIKLPSDPKNTGTWGGSATVYSYFFHGTNGGCSSYMLVYSLETNSSLPSPGVKDCWGGVWNYKNTNYGYTVGAGM